ncbi:polysaccharide biosynthesis protein [Fastidiosibacter lacustris]|uniref:polysaccharide biosynthesis protein n=1 Tax=Fastidiosibacter lacustris TaxID=2056695 RepID=UPI000E34D6E7|nr:nucleoside-diphosphate sugar epimerase/dehydratase [Fastidiosibacter lacustris]
MKTSLIKNKSAWIVFAYDVGSALFAWTIVHALIWGKVSGFSVRQFLFVAIAFTISTKIFRTYASLWKTVSAEDLKRNIYSVLFGSIILLGLEFIANRMAYVARSEAVFYPALTLLITLAGRFFYRQYLLGLRKRNAKKMIIIGGGDGASLFLRENDALNRPYNILGIFDDNKALHGKLLRNNMIVGPIDFLAKENFLYKYPADEVLIAIPSLDKIKLQEIYQKVAKLGLPIKILPSLMELTHGAKFTDLKEIKIEDLLGRDQVIINYEKLAKAYLEKTVLVTGGAGSIGSEICRQLLTNSPPKVLIILDHSEYNLYLIERELSLISRQTKLKFSLTSVMDQCGLSHLFQSNKIDIIFHAAAYKHVPLLEDQPKIAIQNNIIGTKNMVDLSLKHKVERFLLVSTDKAVNPTNVMGATKRIAELYVNAQKNEHTKFMVTRFGNVLGSAGSVVPLFKEQLKKGGPITVTHKDIERYFMTIPEASLLVVLSCAIGTGGETFVLEMGQPVKIVELAEQMIKLSGKKPYVDIDIQFTGLRPGEKMYEELFYTKEELKSSGFDKLLIGRSIHLEREKINGILKTLCTDESKEGLLKVIESLNSCDLLTTQTLYES